MPASENPAQYIYLGDALMRLKALGARYASARERRALLLQLLRDGEISSYVRIPAPFSQYINVNKLRWEDITSEQFARVAINKNNKRTGTFKFSGRELASDIQEHIRKSPVRVEGIGLLQYGVRIADDEFDALMLINDIEVYLEARGINIADQYTGSQDDKRNRGRPANKKWDAVMDAAAIYFKLELDKLGKLPNKKHIISEIGRIATKLDNAKPGEIPADETISKALRGIWDYTDTSAPRGD